MHDLPGESVSSELGALASSSVSSGPSARIQRAVIAGRVFGAVPRTIARFEILEVLGAGASGVVYAALDPLLHRRVALKVLVRPGGDPADTEGWLREARALAQLSHRNVVTIYEVGEGSGYSFLAMELIEGMTLARWLTARRRTLAEISAVFVEAGLGLAAAHACHRVHRDFKPANVLVASDGRVVVTDFGLVDDPLREGLRGAAPHRPVGTPAYAAPEQRRGAAPAASADVYSFAVALTEAVLGSHPRPDASTRWRPLLRRRVSRQLYRAVCAAMVADPRQRTASLAPLLAALSRTRMTRTQRRRRHLAVVAAAAFVLGVAAWVDGRDPSRALHPAPVREGPAALFHAAAELLAAPPQQRDERWAERARTLLLQPVPTRMPCTWPEPPLRVDFEADTAVMLDRQGRHLRCEIRTGRLTFAGEGASRVDVPRWPPDRPPAERVTWQIDDRVLRWRRGVANWQTRTIPTDTRDGVLGPGDDRVLLWKPGRRLDVYDLATGRRYPLADAGIQTAAFLRDGDVVAADDAGQVWRWSIAGLRSWVLADHVGEGMMWAFAACEPGGEIVSTTKRKDDAIQVSSPSGAPQRTLVKPADAQIYALSCRGDEILAGTRAGRVLRWHWPTGGAIGEHDLGVAAWVWAIATSEPPGGPRMDYVGTGTIRPGVIGGRVTALKDGMSSSLYDAHPSGNTGIGELAVSSDGGGVAAATSSGTLARIDVAAGRRVTTVRAHEGEVRRVRFTDADQSLVTAGDDGYLRRWHAGDLALQREVDVRQGQIFDLDVRGTIALVATSRSHVGAWDLDRQRLLHAYLGHGAAVATARFDRSGAWLASGDVAGFVCVHRANRDRCHVELRGHRSGSAVRHVRFLGDGQLITGSDDGTVRQWNLFGDTPATGLAAELLARSEGTP